MKNGKVVKLSPVDEQKARAGCRIRLGRAGQVRLAIGQTEKLGEFEVRMLEGEPPPIPQELRETASILSDDAQVSSISSKEFSDSQAEQSHLYPNIEGYKIIERIGEGGMGVVWRAEQISTKRQVALKLMTSQKVISKKAQARFQREVELTSRLNHPNIARVYESGLHRGMYYYALELIDGVPLDQYVKSNSLTQIQILKLMRTICQAVLYAHLRAVIHRDLKPSNILVTPDGQPHILDFGLAKALLEEEDVLTVSVEGQVTGTPAYMSPEQAAGSHGEIDTRTDVFSLGVILYEILVGQSPHDLSGSIVDVLGRIIEGKIRRPSELNKAVDSELEAILLKALARNPEQRYASAGTLAKDLTNYLDEEPLDARIPTTLYFLRKKAWKYRVQVSIALVVLAVLIFTYTKVIEHRTKLKAAERELQTQIGKAELAEQKIQWTELELKVLGQNEQEARAALRLLRDEYFAAQKKNDELQQGIKALNEKLYKLSHPAHGFTFGELENLGEMINSGYKEAHPQISPDGLELYFSSNRPEGHSEWSIFMSRRATINSNWGKAMHLKSIFYKNNGDDSPTSISADGLELYIHSKRPGGYGEMDIWVARRNTITSPWRPPVNLGPNINTKDGEMHARISSDGLTLYFSSERTDGYGRKDIYVTSRATKNARWGTPVNLGPTINTNANEIDPFIIMNDRVLLFVSDRYGGGGDDIYIAKRSAKDKPWSEPVNLGTVVNCYGPDRTPTVFPDKPVLLFASTRGGGGFARLDLWQTNILPVFDFNRDVKVDIEDLVTLIEHWGELDMTVDIAPLPLGDGVVDETDLEAFLQNWTPEVQQPETSMIATADFNSDGIVDMKDLILLIQNWGQDKPSVDIAPLPSGDGVVDIADLEILMTCWGQKV